MLAGDGCKKHWKNIRDAYTRYKRNNKFRYGSTAPLPKKPRSKWVSYCLMSFLDSSTHIPTQHKSEISNIESLEENTNTAEESTSTQDNLSIDFSQTGLDCDTQNPLESDEDTADPLTRELTIPRNMQRSKHTAHIKKNTKRRRRADNEARLLGYFRKRDASHSVLLQNIIEPKETDELDSFATHIKKVLTKLPPVLKIRAKQEMFDVLTRYEIMAVEPQSSSPSNSLSTSSDFLYFQTTKLEPPSP